LLFIFAKVPKKALTVGVGTVMDAREVLLIATGSSKAVALAQTIEGSVNHMCTSSALQASFGPILRQRLPDDAQQMHPRACIVCDDDATLDLRVRTVRFVVQQYPIAPI
jgi:glucosamine-6-phosphate deaminase